MFQFSIRTLLIITTVVAFVVWILFAPPEWVGMLVMLLIYLALPAVNVAGVLYHTGYWRAFFIGMAPWVVTAWFWTSAYLVNGGWSRWSVGRGGAIEMKLYLAAPLAVIFLSGLLAAAVRWWAIKLDQQNRAPPT